MKSYILISQNPKEFGVDVLMENVPLMIGL
jgi:hypothetical protein